MTKHCRRTRDRTHYTNEYTEALHSSTTGVRRNAARHSTALDNHQLVTYSVIQCMYTCTEATVLSTRLTSCRPYDLRKRTFPKLTLSLSQLSLHSILLSSFVLFMFLYCADVLCKCNTYIIATITEFTAILSFIFSELYNNCTIKSTSYSWLTLLYSLMFE